MDFITKQEIPPVLYVPVKPEVNEGLGAIKMMRLKDGAIAIAAYSALDRLHKFAGKDTAWMLVTTEQLKTRASETGITTIIMDPWLNGLPEER